MAVYIDPELEYTNEVNDNLTLIQRKTGLTFGTDALLLAGYIHHGEGMRALELGGGTGIISLLLATRQKVGHITCIEVQPTYADLAKRNVTLNSLAAFVEVVCADIRDYAASGKAGEFDIVFSNPPYMKGDVPACKHEEKQIARHEVHGGIADFCSVAAKMLRWGGKFYCVWRPDRLVDLLCSMRESGIEPKRMTYVAADNEHAPSVVLVEGMRGGKSGLKVTKTLLIGKDIGERADSPDMTYILNEGRFPSTYE